MRGVNATRALKLDHPGLDTAATRDGARLLLQNDIGTNDAHVLVIQVEGLRVHAHLLRPAPPPLRLLPVAAVRGRVPPGASRRRAPAPGSTSAPPTTSAPRHLRLRRRRRRCASARGHRRAHRVPDRLEPRAQAARAVRRQDRRGGDPRRGGAPARRPHGLAAAGGERWCSVRCRRSGRSTSASATASTACSAPRRPRLRARDHGAGQRWRTQQRQPLALVADDTRLLLARYLHRTTSSICSPNTRRYCHALAEACATASPTATSATARRRARFSERAKDWERRADQLVMDARARAEAPTALGGLRRAGGDRRRRRRRARGGRLPALADRRRSPPGLARRGAPDHAAARRRGARRGAGPRARARDRARHSARTAAPRTTRRSSPRCGGCSTPSASATCCCATCAARSPSTSATRPR
jgi:hypothetical protein